jgi:hypothetical protein
MAGTLGPTWPVECTCPRRPSEAMRRAIDGHADLCPAHDADEIAASVERGRLEAEVADARARVELLRGVRDDLHDETLGPCLCVDLTTAVGLELRGDTRPVCRRHDVIEPTTTTTPIGDDDALVSIVSRLFGEHPDDPFGPPAT